MVKAAIKDEEFTMVTFIWMQGEQDTREKNGDVYAANRMGLVAQLSDDLKTR